jgi:hypothetical protein
MSSRSSDAVLSDSEASEHEPSNEFRRQADNGDGDHREARVRLTCLERAPSQMRLGLQLAAAAQTVETPATFEQKFSEPFAAPDSRIRIVERRRHRASAQATLSQLGRAHWLIGAIAGKNPDRGTRRRHRDRGRRNLLAGFGGTRVYVPHHYGTSA